MKTSLPGAAEIRSADIIERHQDASGAYIASPNFPTYASCWLRDGSFTAYAMIRAGRPAGALRFLEWTARAILRHAGRLDALRENLSSGKGVGSSYLPTRYALDGTAVEDDWPNFQVDGYGTWLWCLDEYLSATGDAALLERLRPAVGLTLEYLQLVWDQPNWDCWEERGDLRHPATYACVFGGAARMASRLAGTGEGEAWASIASAVKARLDSLLLPEGRFPKSEGFPSVDASLIWIALPFGVLAPDDPRMASTVAEIERRCLVSGGVKRYPEDTYYGGGRWIILSAWLGWWYVSVGRISEAERLLEWIELTADGEGGMPEQTTDLAVDGTYVKEWTERWGPVAKPLLWSHAMHIVLCREIAEAKAAGE
ncbi:MAG: hypothetical protein A2Y36_06490 [Treponema sp. GWA1_62_8]|nr:MAG: hypothetical protein A2Y36_06490 [Treponema sp. GWA1_62_8]OHE67773.1 MAG: hypothetical protein A2001_14585 [Treponema sp. GWC1_61_84]